MDNQNSNRASGAVAVVTITINHYQPKTPITHTNHNFQ